MSVLVFFNSSDITSTVSAQIVKSKYPSAEFLDTTGLNETAIDSLISGVTAASQSKIWILADVGTNPPAGNLVAGQVTTIDSTLFDGLPGSDTAAIVIPAESVSAPNSTVGRTYATWQSVYPGENVAYLPFLLGRVNYWLWLASGTATAGGASTITDSAVTFPVDSLAGKYVYITDGTGAGQVREITTNSATVLTVSPAWSTTPDNTSEYIVRGYKLSQFEVVEAATATSGANTSITNSAGGYTASSLIGYSVRILSGTGAGQERMIVSNTTTAITVVNAWGTNPDNTSVFEVVGYSFQGENARLLEPTATATSGGATTIANTALSVAWPTNIYQGKQVQIVGGTGSGQKRMISSNTGDTITVSQAWAVNPDTTSQYQIVDPFSNWEYELADFYLPLAIQTSLNDISNGSITERYNAILGKQIESVRLQKGNGQDLQLLNFYIQEGKTIYDYLLTT